MSTNSLTIVSTFTKDLWEEYGNRSIPTWFQYFDSTVKFHLHTEFKPIIDQRITYFLDTKEKLDFLKRNTRINRQGTKDMHPVGRKWDTYCHKVYAQYESFKKSDTRYLLFLDADVAALKSFNGNIAADLLDNHFCGFIGRDSLLTETGFILYDLHYPGSSQFFESFIDLYNKDQLFNLTSWCDCGAFDHIRTNSPLLFKNLSGQYSHFIDPIAVGEIGEYFDHWISKKSKRKGFSKHRKFRNKV
jgi:hypothetical protein